MLVFDGDCGFCTRCADWASARLPALTIVVPWQRIPDLAAVGLRPEDVTDAAWWIEGDGDRRRGADAIAQTLVMIGGVYRWVGRAMQLPGLSTMAAIGYRVVARYRHRLPGGTPACELNQSPRTQDR